MKEDKDSSHKHDFTVINSTCAISYAGVWHTSKLFDSYANQRLWSTFVATKLWNVLLHWKIYFFLVEIRLTFGILMND